MGVMPIHMPVSRDVEPISLCRSVGICADIQYTFAPTAGITKMTRLRPVLMVCGNPSKKIGEGSGADVS